MTIKKRIILTLALIIALVLLQGLAGILYERQVDNTVLRMLELQKKNTFLKDKLADHMEWVGHLLESMLLQTPFEGQLDPALCEFGKWYYEFKKTAEYTSLPDRARAIIDQVEAYHSALHQSAGKIGAERDAAARQKIFTEEVQPALHEVQRLFREYVNYNNEIVEQLERELSSMSVILDIISTGIFFVILLIAAALGFFLSRSISSAFKKFRSGYDRLKQGDLTASISMTGNDEFAVLSAMTREFVDHVQQVIRNVRGISLQLATSADEMSATSLSFSENAQDQAATAEEVTAAIEEISANMDSIAERAGDQLGDINHMAGRVDVLAGAMASMSSDLGSAATDASDIATVLNRATNASPR